MKKIMLVLLALSIVAGTVVITYADSPVNPFVDVSENAWYHDEVVKAVSTGIINGKSETLFKPDDLLTYAEAVKLAACMNQVYLNGKVTLTSGTPWYQTYADYCKKNKIISKEYNYNENATRAGYMEIFANALPDSAFKDINNIPDGSILDVKGNEPYAIYVYKLYRAGIVTGVDAVHSCNPEANIKRCEVATIISRMMDEEKRVEFEMPGTEEPENEPKNEPEKEPEKEPENEPEKEPEKVPESEITTPDISFENEKESIVVTTDPVKIPDYNVDNNNFTLSFLTIYKQPEGLESESYGIAHTLEVQVFGGKPPYTYEWQYKNRRDNVTVTDGDYAKNASTAKLILSVEKENALLGKAIFCRITDSEGTSLTTDSVKVYGPFSMPAENSLSDSGNYLLTGRIADGKIKKGDKVSIERNGKIIATGTAVDLQMFEKSIDECAKDDNIALVFELEKGVRPTSGDIVIKYKDTHVIDTSDIIN